MVVRTDSYFLKENEDLFRLRDELVITDIMSDESGSFETKTVTYGELCGKEVSNKATFALYTYAPTSVAGVKTALKEFAIVAGNPARMIKRGVQWR